MVEHIQKLREVAAVTDDDNPNYPDRHSITVSIEVEKTKPELAKLIPLADVVSAYSMIV